MKKIFTFFVSAIIINIVLTPTLFCFGKEKRAIVTANRDCTTGEKIILLRESFSKSQLISPTGDNLPIGSAWILSDDNAEGRISLWRVDDDFDQNDNPNSGSARNDRRTTGGAKESQTSAMAVSNLNLSGFSNATLEFDIWTDTMPGDDPLLNEDYFEIRLIEISGNHVHTGWFNSRNEQSKNNLPKKAWTPVSIQLPQEFQGSKNITIEFMYITGSSLSPNGAGVAIDNILLWAEDGYDNQSPLTQSSLVYKNDNSQTLSVKAVMKYGAKVSNFLPFDLGLINEISINLPNDSKINKRQLANDIFNIYERGRAYDQWAPMERVSDIGVDSYTTSDGATLKFPGAKGENIKDLGIDDILLSSAVPIYGLWNLYDTSPLSLVKTYLNNPTKRYNLYKDLFLSMITQGDFLQDPDVASKIADDGYGQPDNIQAFISTHKQIFVEYEEKGLINSADATDEEKFWGVWRILTNSEIAKPEKFSNTKVGKIYNTFNQINSLLDLGNTVLNIPDSAYVKTIDGLGLGFTVLDLVLDVTSDVESLTSGKDEAIAVFLHHFSDLEETALRISAVENSLILHGDQIDPQLLSAWRDACTETMAIQIEALKTYKDYIGATINGVFKLTAYATKLATIFGSALEWSGKLQSLVGNGTVSFFKTLKNSNACLAITNVIEAYKQFKYIYDQTSLLSENILSYNVRCLLLDGHQFFINEMIVDNESTITDYQRIRQLFNLHSYLSWREVALVYQSQETEGLLSLVLGGVKLFTEDSWLNALDYWEKAYRDEIFITYPLPTFIEDLENLIQINYEPEPNIEPEGIIFSPTADLDIQRGQTIRFQGTASDADGNYPCTLNWNLNGNRSDGSSVNMDFPATDFVNLPFPDEGSFTITLTAIDSKGLEDFTPSKISIMVKPKPEDGHDISIKPGCEINFGDDAVESGDLIRVNALSIENAGDFPESPVAYLSITGPDEFQDQTDLKTLPIIQPGSQLNYGNQIKYQLPSNAVDGYYQLNLVVKLQNGDMTPQNNRYTGVVHIGDEVPIKECVYKMKEFYIKYDETLDYTGYGDDSGGGGTPFQTISFNYQGQQYTYNVAFGRKSDRTRIYPIITGSTTISPKRKNSGAGVDCHIYLTSIL